MPRISQCFFVILLILFQWAVMPEMGHAQDTVSAYFNGGNSSSVADAYPGLGDAGWFDQWEELRSGLAGEPYTNYRGDERRTRA